MDLPKLFLSYNSADRTSVIAVQKLLQARGIATFLDRDQLVAGLPWGDALEQGLKDADAVAVFIGHELGGWQKRELWFALDRQVREEKQGQAFPVVPVLLPGADLTAGFLFSNTWVDLRAGLAGSATAESLDALASALKGTSPGPAITVSAAQAAERAAALCPYRGLEVFREEDAAFFAGRQTFASQLLEFTLGKDLVVVVGPSGSGKSSVVQAGLIPLLRRQLPPANTWDTVIFTPGSDPCHRLASALIPLLEPELTETARLAEAEELGRNLAEGRTRVEAVMNRVIEKSKGTGRLLLVADQFEELFTLTPEPRRRPLVESLLGALGNAPFTLLLTLRADFYSQVIGLDRELSDRLAPAQVNIGALTPDELRESITTPARLVGLEFEAGLVERILTDVGSEPGRLPLVEFALTELWQRREGNRLANRAYDEIGGVTGALARRAEAEFAGLRPEEQAAARRLFSRLVRVARPDEAGEDTRQRADLGEADKVAKRVATEFADARLLVTGIEGDATLSVEVAHEALIRNWERLRSWLNQDREFLLWRQRLQAQVEEWHRRGEDAGYLLRGAPLAEAERWLLDRPHDLTSGEQSLIKESIALRNEESHASRRRKRRLFVLSGALIGLIGVLGGAVLLESVQAKRSAARLAESLKAQQVEAQRTDLAGALTVFGTSYGREALETAEGRGLFTSQLEKYLFREYVSVSRAVSLAQRQGVLKSGSDQQAEVLSSMNGDVFLNPRNERRRFLALVAGWDSYAPPWPRLTGAVADARSIDNGLRKAGYPSRLLTNASSAELNEAIDQLLSEAAKDCQTEGPNVGSKPARGFEIVRPIKPCDNELVFLYFAGHGWVSGGTTYVVPGNAGTPETTVNAPGSFFSIEGLRGRIAERAAAQIIVADVSRPLLGR